VELGPGTIVSTNIRLAEPLGEGAMGSVWVADHLTLKTQVAVKFIASDLAQGDPELLSRFEREATAAAQIKSPHVVQTFDHGVMIDGTPFIVMELLEGQSLMELIDEQGTLPMSVASQVLVQVARALSKAHEAGIVHRDIKPDNIFVTPSEDGVFCKILDFGIAKETQLPKMGGLTNRGVMIGTPEYMSPEQVMSAKDVDHRADLWALGVTLYQCLTGALPFTAEALGELCMKLLEARFTPPSELRPDLPKTVDQWFARALARDAEARYASAREAARAFVALVAQRPEMADQGSFSDLVPIVATPPKVPPSGAATMPGTLGGSAANLQRPTQVTRRPGKITLGLAAGAGVIALGGVVTLLALRSDEHIDPVAPGVSAPGADHDGDDRLKTSGRDDDDSLVQAHSAAPTASSAPTETEPTESAKPSGSAAAPDTAIAQPRPPASQTTDPFAPPRQVGSGKPVREDHGF